MNIRVIQWNISFKAKADEIAEYLTNKIQGETIINLQEVIESTHKKISAILQPDGEVFSLDLRKPGNNEGKNRKMGVATYVFGGAITNSDLISRSIFPERTLFTSLKFKNVSVNNLNFHSLTGVDYKKAKSSNFSSIADFIQEENLDFFTCDANEPKTDSLNDDDIVFFDNKDKGINAGLIFGANKVHHLKDAFKIHLKNNNQKTNAEPLAISHIISKKFNRRYDHIYCNSNWQPKIVTYPYNDSIMASSDHSAVIGDFSLNIGNN